MMIRFEAWRLACKMRRIGIARLEEAGFLFLLHGRFAVYLNDQPIWMPLFCRWWLRRAIKAQSIVDAFGSLPEAVR